MTSDRAQINRRLDRLHDAIADGLRTPGLKGELEDLEARHAELDARLAAPLPSPVRLHPNLAEIYRRKVAALAETLGDPEIRTAAIETIRSLITSVTIHEDGESVRVELEGAITAMIELAQPGAEWALDLTSVKVVAGVGFEPTTFRL